MTTIDTGSGKAHDYYSFAIRGVDGQWTVDHYVPQIMDDTEASEHADAMAEDMGTFVAYFRPHENILAGIRSPF